MDSNEPPTKKRCTYDVTEIVVVKVGKSKKSYAVHKTFLIKSSKFFQAAMQEQWAEGGTRTVELPEIKAEAFTSYLNWLYTGTLAESGDDLPQYQMDEATSNERYDIAFNRCNQLCDLAILADFLDDSQLRDTIVDSFLRTGSKLHLYAGPCHLEKLWANLPPTSKLRIMLTDFYAGPASIDMFQNPVLRAKMPSEFVMEVLLALKRERMGGAKLISPNFSNRCRYHEHGQEKTCK